MKAEFLALCDEGVPILQAQARTTERSGRAFAAGLSRVSCGFLSRLGLSAGSVFVRLCFLRCNLR